MILEAFSQILHQEWHGEGASAVGILHRWLFGQLAEAHPRSHVTKVIHTELELHEAHEETIIVPRSKTGELLLRSLYMYCESYERWQFSRWLHHIKPNNFNKLSS